VLFQKEHATPFVHVT